MSAPADPIQRAKGIATSRSAEEAAAFLDAYARAHADDYTFHFDAGKLLEDAGAQHLALDYFTAALALKRTAAAIERVFACNLKLGRNRDAVRALLMALETGYRVALRKDFALALRRAAPGALDAAGLQLATAKFQSDILVGPGLLLHLIAAGRAAEVEAIAANGAIDPRYWDEDLTMETAAFLESRGKPELALRVMCRCGGQSEAYMERLTAALDRHSPAELKAKVLPMLDVPEGRFSTVVFGEPYLEIAERFARVGDADAAFDTVIRMKDAMVPAAAAAFYGRYRARIGALIEFIVAAGRDDMLDRLSAFCVFWLDTAAHRFFLGPEFEGMVAYFTAPKLADSRPGTRRALLRDKYFEHHLERREKERLPQSASDLQLSLFALRYFRSLAKQVPADSIPLPPGITEHLKKPALSLTAGRAVDVLMACAPAEGVPESMQAAEDEYIWRYIGSAVPENNIPSDLIAEWIFDDLNAVETRHALPGVNVTKFLRASADNSAHYRERYDPTSAPDSLLLFLDLTGILLFKYPQYRRFFAAMLPAEGTKERDFLRRCIAHLCGNAGMADAFLAALAGKSTQQAATPSSDDGQHVLLIGHASKTTGLGRNVKVLHDALTANAGEGIVTEILDVDAKGLDVIGRLRKWREGAGARPIVICAVNAEDVPLTLLKDTGGVFDDAHVVGFFLWEMSKSPDAQQLGIELVDEIWTPSRYVADVYAPLKQTHMIGKGLYDAALPPIAPPRGKTFRFLTVFDFDSSIERKNPLAVVQAFQKAFGSKDDVELVVKGSGIKPAHWSNALHQWERLTAAIAGDKRIRLITERISDEAMDDLFRSAGCMVSLHRGEGFGYVIADAMAMGMPVIATDYSGNADYCTAENSFPVACRTIPVDRKVAQWDTNGAEWADADIDSAAAQMRAVVANRDAAMKVAAKGRETVLRQFDKDAFRKTVLERINAIRTAR